MSNRTGTGWCGRLAVLLAVMLVAGCAGQTPRSSFYVLSAESGPLSGVAGSCSSQAISVGPVNWPRYLDQPRIVTRVGSNRLEENEFNRWSGSLEDDFVRITIENLSGLLQSELVVNYRRSSRYAPVYRVEMDVLRFDGALGGDVVLEVKWNVIAEATGKIELVTTSSIQKGTSGPDYEALVNASSMALAQLSEDIATQLAQLCAAG
jgi:uncharacterized lipoprotein YmbA